MKNQTIIASILSTVVIGCHSEQEKVVKIENDETQEIVWAEPKIGKIDLSYYIEEDTSMELIKQLRDEISSLKIQLAKSEEKRHNSFNDGLSAGYMRGYGACTEYFMNKLDQSDMSADEAADYVSALMQSRVSESVRTQEGK